MVQHGYLEQAVADKVAKQPITVSGWPRPKLLRARGAGLVYKLLVEKYMAEAIPSLGAAVKTTLDFTLQDVRRARRSSVGSRTWTRARVTAGPLGHHEGAKLEQYRHELKLAREEGRPVPKGEKPRPPAP